MANGIYTALDNDMNYLAHYGVKNMKWYKHLFGVQQSLSKYAKGTNTEGINLNKAMAKKARQNAQEAMKSGDKGKARYFMRAEQEANKRAAALEKADRRSAIPRKLAGAAAAVIGFGLRAADKAYSGYHHTKNFITNSRYRKVKMSEFGKSVKKKAKAFSELIGGALKDAGTAISKVPGTITKEFNRRFRKPKHGSIAVGGRFATSV